MTALKKNSSGKYIKNGKTFDMLTGTRAQVFHGTAYKTSGGLVKDDLFQNKAGRIVSKKKHNTAKKEKRLIKYGFYTKKGHFGCITKSGRKCTKKHKGGMTMLEPGSFPASVGMVSSTSPDAVFPTTLGGKKHKTKKYRKGGMALTPLSLSPYPEVIGSNNDPNGLGSLSQQNFLVAPNNTPNDLALTKALGGKKMKGGVGIRHPLGSTAVQMRAGLGN